MKTSGKSIQTDKNIRQHRKTNKNKYKPIADRKLKTVNLGITTYNNDGVLSKINK